MLCYPMNGLRAAAVQPTVLKPYPDLTIGVQASIILTILPHSCLSAVAPRITGKCTHMITTPNNVV